MGIAFVVVVVAAVLVAMGRGDGLSVERNDYLELDLGPVSATDVALLRPPTGLWGYNMQATDEAMELIAESIRERDVRIVALEQLVSDLSQEPAALLSSPYITARHRRSMLDPASPEPQETAPWTEPQQAAPEWTEPQTTASRPEETAPPRPAEPATAAGDGDQGAPPEQSHD